MTTTAVLQSLKLSKCPLIFPSRFIKKLKYFMHFIDYPVEASQKSKEHPEVALFYALFAVRPYNFVSILNHHYVQCRIRNPNHFVTISKKIPFFIIIKLSSKHTIAI